LKIWYQSSALLGIDPKWDPYYESLKKHVQKVARSDTKVDVRGVKFSHPLRERSSYVEYLHKAQIIDNAIQAEREGYDAFCVACALDPGFSEIREVVDIPVAFLFESCLHLASILASTFCLLASSEDALAILRQKIKQYGCCRQIIQKSIIHLCLPSRADSGLTDAGRQKRSIGPEPLLPAVTGNPKKQNHKSNKYKIFIQCFKYFLRGLPAAAVVLSCSHPGYRIRPRIAYCSKWSL